MRWFYCVWRAITPRWDVPTKRGDSMKRCGRRRAWDQAVRTQVEQELGALR